MPAGITTCPKREQGYDSKNRPSSQALDRKHDSENSCSEPRVDPGITAAQHVQPDNPDDHAYG